MRPKTLGLILAFALVLAACGGGAGETTTTADVGQEDTTTTAAESDATTTTAQPSTSTTAPEMMEGVHASDSDLGEILVDPDGFTLYIFTADSDGESTCYDACADLWPPVPADTTISSDLDASIFGSTPRTSGSDQLTVNGMPLYRYTPDVNPGDVTGQGFNDVWFVVDASGTVIEAAATSGGDIDYDY
jgi:predicted lipoprotein with Yx(FWY)xxD motif